jgi:serine/threonine protein phosphatase PrpC
MAATGQVLEQAPSRAPGAFVASAQAPVPWALVTDPGPGRSHNEDRWRVDEAGGVFALADGMGGYNAGEVASEIATRTVAERVCASRAAGLSPADALLRAVAVAHRAIVEFAHTRPECLGMATTLVVACVVAERLVVAHVGDSRAYLYREGTLRRLTRDHSIGQQMLDAGRMTESQVRRLPARGILTRALGIKTEPPVADVAELDWRAGDLLLLCTDGLTDSLDDGRLAAALGEADAPIAPLARLAGELIVAATDRGCTDDATVLLAGGAGATPAAR